MPTKEVTETQLLRLLSNTPLQIDITLVRMEGHISKNTNKTHLDRFYMSSNEIFNHKFDGMIITGAPVEQIPFEEVDYWNELCKIMDYAKENVSCTLYICWGAMAGLYHLYGIDKKVVSEKFSGIYHSKLLKPHEPLMRGFDDYFPVPTSRYTIISSEDIKKNKNLTLLAESKDTGLTIAKSKDNRSIFMTGHLEYDTDTLATEYKIDLKKNLNVKIPKNYFVDNDPEKEILSTWRSTAHLFYSNWLNYYVYQTTPYIL
jgi:homoserine O-succinyltransferase